MNILVLALGHNWSQFLFSLLWFLFVCFFMSFCFHLFDVDACIRIQFNVLDKLIDVNGGEVIHYSLKIQKLKNSMSLYCVKK